jgi:putative ribosome biogenesis GTPase RsgA
MDVPGVATFGFAIPTESVTAVPHPPARPELIRVTYERAVLPRVLQAGGAEVLHASAVYVRDGVVALCGDSGVGKSTTAMALSRRGHPLWADDVVALDMTGRHP